jgi:hypothetical protein
MLHVKVSWNTDIFIRCLDFIVHLVEGLFQSVEENGCVMRLEYQRGTQTNGDWASTSRLNPWNKIINTFAIIL